jgi:hypothetical protein
VRLRRAFAPSARNRPDVELTLMVPGPPAMDPESAEMMKKLVAKGVLGAGALTRTSRYFAEFGSIG